MSNLSINKDVEQFERAVTCLQQGKIIAYPTEAVYGLGCDPYNEQAVISLLILKRRPVSKGLILIASGWEQIDDLILPLPPSQRLRIEKTWPGPTTWVFPASSRAPNWITGSQGTIALRITCHPIAKQLCTAFKRPIVSTSANLAGQNPVRTFAEASKLFKDKICLIMDGSVGELTKPTVIRDAMTGTILRD